MLKVTSAVQQIVTELSEAVLEKGKMMIITKLVPNLMKQNACRISYAAQSHSI
jgi:hypothetical protein